MGLIDEVTKRAGVSMLMHGALRLVRVDEAGRVLDICASDGLRVLGVECFRVEGSKVFPDMHAIADFSAALSAEESIADARRFLRQLDSAEYFVELELEAHPERDALKRKRPGGAGPLGWG